MPRYARLDIFAFGKFDITALTVGFDMIFACILLVRSTYRVRKDISSTKCISIAAGEYRCFVSLRAQS